MTWVDWFWFFTFVFFWILIPPKWDPAIRLKEWQERRRKRK